MKTNIKLVVRHLRDDKRYKRLEDSFNTVPIYNLPREELLKELKTIHELREIRRLNPNEPAFVDKLVNANTHDQAMRSRCAEITMSCAHVRAKLSAAIEALKHHYILEYSDHLRQFRTKEERSMVMNIALKKFVKYVDDVSYIKEIADIVVMDIDKGGWSLSRSIEAMKIHSLKERQL